METEKGQDGNLIFWSNSHELAFVLILWCSLVPSHKWEHINSFLSNIFLCQFGWTFTVEKLEEKYCQTQTDLGKVLSLQNTDIFQPILQSGFPHCGWCLDTMLGHVWSTSRPSAEDVDLRGDAWREFFFEKIGGPHLKGSRKILVFLFLLGHLWNDH